MIFQMSWEYCQNARLKFRKKRLGDSFSFIIPITPEVSRATMKILPLSIALSSLLFGVSLPAMAQANTESNSSVLAVQPMQMAQSGVLLQESGVLEPGDEVLESDNSLYDIYDFDGASGQTITIDLESSEFDTYLAIISPSGELLAENDDTDGSTNSSISITLSETGTFTIVVNGYDSTSQGEYLLTAY